ncbi:hypothetical protein AFE_2020 [Acidithiobacillus ferrooxidans ATCC 23270]|uniref:Uncharacterized protein n=1 Tax=Acidithiobacillus ferrooxidans (strain ATCC 23270 / DSM 14882 / CIP 104768 / NCIMB 8455) TaxID=243159 RepID=B7J4N1_ACIF2|nr:hypothetical protein AFE_2020 [Acidithiobacillus ferrooxidans ATCC 23270]
MQGITRTLHCAGKIRQIGDQTFQPNGQRQVLMLEDDPAHRFCAHRADVHAVLLQEIVVVVRMNRDGFDVAGFGKKPVPLALHFDEPRHIAFKARRQPLHKSLHIGLCPPDPGSILVEIRAHTRPPTLDCRKYTGIR